METKFTKGPWAALRMVHAETGEDMTPAQLGEYVKNAVLINPGVTEYLFVSVEKDGVPHDVCHVGNGPDRAFNAALIAAAPEIYEALMDALCALEVCGKDYDYVMGRARNALSKARGES